MIDVTLYNYMDEVLKRIPVSFHRYMYTQVSWDSRQFGLNY